MNNTNSDTNKILFIEQVLSVIFQPINNTVKLYRPYLFDYVPSKLFKNYDEELSVNEIIERCKIFNEVDNTFDKIVKTLIEDWKRLTPNSKRSLLNYINQFKLNNYFPAHSITFTHEDEEADRIKWSVADVIYNHEKESAFKQCKDAGLDLNADQVILISEFKAINLECTRILIDLLKKKASTLLSVVQLAVRDNMYKYIEGVRGRTYYEYLHILVKIRKAYNNLYLDWVTPTDELQRKSTKEQIEAAIKWRARELAENALEPFKNEFEEFYASINRYSNPGRDIYEKTLRLLKDQEKSAESVTHNYNPTFMHEEYKFDKTQGVFIKTQGEVHDIHFNQTNSEFPSNFDFEQAQKELSQLLAVLKEKAKTTEELKALVNVAEAEEAAKTKDGNKLIQFLKKAGSWTFETAKDIGVELVAALIKQHMGMPA